MTKLASSNAIGQKLLELLGIPHENCISAVIVLEVNKAVVVEARYYAGMNLDRDTGDLSMEIQKYRLEVVDE